MTRKIVTAISVIAGLAALPSMYLPGVTSAASSPVTEGGTSARMVKEGEVARSASWTFEGEADLSDSGALELRIRATAGAPRAFDLVSRLLVGRDVLLVNSRAPIADVRGRAVALSRLDDAILRVKGTLLPAGQWRYDLDGEATPTIRVSRILVLSLDPD